MAASSAAPPQQRVEVAVAPHPLVGGFLHQWDRKGPIAALPVPCHSERLIRRQTKRGQAFLVASEVNARLNIAKHSAELVQSVSEAAIEVRTNVMLRAALQHFEQKLARLEELCLVLP
jgi:hypothetical protein